MIIENLRLALANQATSGGLKYVRPVGRKEARGIVALVYKQVQIEYQLVPPLTLHSHVPDLMAAVWGILRESLLVGGASRVDREVVAATVSRINACPFCIEAHAMSLHGAGNHELASSLISDGKAQDPGVQRLLTWASSTRTPNAPALLEPPFSPTDKPYFVGTALAFHYINRVVHVFLGDSPLPTLSDFAGMKSTIRKVAGKLLMGRLMGQTLTPGLSEGMHHTVVPGSIKHPDFAWAAGNEHVLQAWQNFQRVTERLGAHYVPLQIRELLINTLEKWHGEEKGLSRGWVDELSRSLPSEQQPAARLVLLVALASHQIDDQIVQEFMAIEGNERLLVPTVAWASALATFRIEKWICPTGSR